MRLALAFILIACLSVQSSFAGRFYKWVDDAGHTHYSETPPEQSEGNIEPIDTINASSDQAQELEALEANRESAAEAETQAAEAAEAEAQRLVDIERNRAPCEQSYKNLTSLDSGRRIRVIGDDGERSYMTEAQKAERRKLLETNIETCRDLGITE